MRAKILFHLTRMFYRGPKKESILFLLSSKIISKEEIVKQIDSLYTACHNGYYMYVNDPEKTESLIEFFSSEAENLEDFTNFIESFNSDFNLEVTLASKKTFDYIKKHLVYFSKSDTDDILDHFFMSKSKLTKAMNKMLNSRIIALDEEITLRSYIKTLSGNDTFGTIKPDDDKWN